MAGLDPAIHVFGAVLEEDVDARDEPGHDDGSYGQGFGLNWHDDIIQ
jgi:hypothetical protein